MKDELSRFRDAHERVYLRVLFPEGKMDCGRHCLVMNGREELPNWRTMRSIRRSGKFLKSGMRKIKRSGSAPRKRGFLSRR